MGDRQTRSAIAPDDAGGGHEPPGAPAPSAPGAPRGAEHAEHGDGSDRASAFERRVARYAGTPGVDGRPITRRQAEVLAHLDDSFEQNAAGYRYLARR